MKRILAIALCLVMALAIVACGNTTPSVTEADYKLGMGVVVSMGSSKTGNAQVDATVATVVTDADGKIVACRIDVAQNKMDITDGAVDAAKTFETKMELGSRYGMAGKVDNNDDGVMLESSILFSSRILEFTTISQAILKVSWSYSSPLRQC